MKRNQTYEYKFQDKTKTTTTGLYTMTTSAQYYNKAKKAGNVVGPVVRRLTITRLGQPEFENNPWMQVI